MPLPDAMEDVLPIAYHVRLVQRGFGHEVADAEADTPVLEAVTQHVEQAFHVAGVVEGDEELPLRIDGVHVGEALPLPRLGGLDEAQQRIREQPQLRVIGIRALRIASLGGEEERLDVALKALFGCICYGHTGASFFPVTYS